MADSGGDRGGIVAPNVAPAETSTSGDGQDPKKSDMGDPQDLRAGKAELKACDDPVQELLNMAAGTVNQTETSHTKQWLGCGDEAEARKDSHKHVPGPLQALPLSLDDIRASLDNIVQQHCLAQSSHMRSLTGETLRRLDDAGKAVVVSHSLAAYLSTLEAAVLRKVTARIVSDTGLWVSRLFRFFDSSVFFHEESREGLVRVCRLALHAKYPRLAQGEGFQALAPRPPVLYIGAHTRTSLGHHLCSQLGLPVSCLRMIPLTGTPGSLYQTDLAALEQSMDEDVAQGRVPTLVVVSAGSPAIGLVDPLQGLQDLCKRHEAWLHVEGHALAALCLVSVPNLPARTGDSVSLPLGTWLGLPSVPYVTLYKTSEAALAHAAGLSSFSVHSKLQCLPLWVGLQSLGHQGLLQRVLHCLRLSEMLRERLDQIPEIEVVGRPRAISKEGQVLSLADVVTKSVGTLLLFDVVVPVVTFRYLPEEALLEGVEEEEETQEEEVTEVSSETESKRNTPDEATAAGEKAETDAILDDEPSLHDTSYRNNLNSWLAQVLNRDVPRAALDLLDLDPYGACLRFCPLESAHVFGTTTQDVEELHNCLLKHLAILNATVRQKRKFREALSKHDNLELVEVCHWAGLGGVRFVPNMYVGRVDSLDEKDRIQLNQLNSELVLKLKNTDSAFSLGESEDGLSCVRFGMVTDDLDIEELVGLVLGAGIELEESTKALESMSELVKQGIQEASKGLQQENEEKILQEGLLRHVPIVGSLFNWWSPTSKESGIRGRSFNITSGLVESTENIYKYHMQIQQGDGTPVLANKPPPQAQVVVPAANALETKAQH
uniref:Pyridoxal-dependent decarboxylase domain-containing protein 1 n=1 Tax=Rhipicephalus appendiculatus TaxID=34631 RepID=A0A131YWY3_RHIAP